MEKRYRFRIYPTHAQEVQIQKNFGCCRFVYNYFLAKQIEHHNAGKGYVGLYDTTKTLPELKRTQGYEWLKEADSASLSYVLCDLDNAFKRFFKNVKKGNVSPGFPRFKSKKEKFKSYRCKNKAGRQPGHQHSIEVSERHIKLPKLGLVKCRATRPIEGRILNVSVLQNASGKYFASIYCTDAESGEFPKTGKSAGLHLGLRDLVTLSDGEQIKNHRYLEKTQKKLTRLRRQLSRKSSDSKNREKARIKLAKAFEKISNQKTDAFHKITTRIVREYDIICVRNELVQQMQANPIFAKYLADANWSTILRQLAYKCEWYGKIFIKVDNLLPSAKMCSSCGHINSWLKPHHYEWDCPKCGANHNRATNAAVNILNEGLLLLSSAQNAKLNAHGIKVRSGRPESKSAESA